MITIEYIPTGLAISDNEAENFVFSLKDNDFVSVSTSNVIFAAKVLSLEHNIPVQFMFNGNIIKMNEYGAIHDWPKGFCDYILNWNSKVIQFAVNKRKKEKKGDCK